MPSQRSPSTQPPRPPWAALGWTLAFDGVILLSLLFVAAFVLGPDIDGESPSIAGAVAVVSPIVLLALLMTHLRRGRAWAWVLQLVVICLICALAMPFSIVIIPLLVAWCGPAVRDWFDPPLRREFGRR